MRSVDRAANKRERRCPDCRSPARSAKGQSPRLDLPDKLAERVGFDEHAPRAARKASPRLDLPDKLAERVGFDEHAPRAARKASPRLDLPDKLAERVGFDEHAPRAARKASPRLDLPDKLAERVGFDEHAPRAARKDKVPGSIFPINWRRGWDLNPRARFCQATRFRGGLFQPLRHLSERKVYRSRTFSAIRRHVYRRAAKNACIVRAHSFARTPPSTSTWWLRAGWLKISKQLCTAPPFGSSQPYTSRSIRA
jgi:hypothetical protein